ncbi:MAG: UvrB/UvrC motif-containing protein [candidate division WOR-3 bacterium]
MKHCSLCQKPEVTIIITTIDKDGKVCELALCKECAEKKGVGEIKKSFLPPQVILSELQEKITNDDYQLTCPACGISYADFRKHGRLGCENCYLAFSEKLEVLIKRLHGTTSHIGKSVTPSKKLVADRFEIKKLQLSLKKAIQEEDYERAAAIRDQIRQIRQNTT